MLVKGWKVEQIAQETLKYNWTLVRNYFYNSADVMEENAKLDVIETIKESEKAIYVTVRCLTVGSEMDREFKTWIPKSAIIAA